MALKMFNPALAATTVQGLAANYVADASGTITVSDYRDIEALSAQGWQIVPIGAISGSAWQWALTNITPNASIGVYGVAKSMTPPSNFLGLMPLSLDLVYSSIGSETVTVQIIVTLHDGTTVTIATFTSTTNQTVSFTNAQLRALLGATPAAVPKIILSISFQLKSTISSSGCLLAVNGHGETI